MSKFWGLCLALAFVPAAALPVTPSVAKVGAACGGFPGLACGRGEFCQHPPGTCFIPDMQGTCAKVPGICSMIYLPVCGCNGKTYANACLRMHAKVSKAHDGKCWETK